jgi:hypothetical protein
MTRMLPEQAGVRLIDGPIEHGDREIIEPDVFPDRRAGGTDFRDDAVIGIMDVTRRAGIGDVLADALREAENCKLSANFVSSNQPKIFVNFLIIN